MDGWSLQTSARESEAEQVEGGLASWRGADRLASEKNNN
jgi:hypothetical protein